MRLFFRSIYTTTITLALLALAIHLAPDALARVFSHRPLGYIFCLLTTALALVGSDLMMRVAPGRPRSKVPEVDLPKAPTYRNQYVEGDGNVVAQGDIDMGHHAYRDVRFGDYIIDKSSPRVSIITQGTTIQIKTLAGDVTARYEPQNPNSGIRLFPA